MTNSTFLTTSNNGKKVYYDAVASHAATHFADTPQLKEIVTEILSQTDLTNGEMRFEHDMGHTIGATDLVENDKDDTIVYAKRLNRDIYTSFNKTKRSQPTSLVAICITKIDDTSYELLTAWTGSINAPSFPGDENETPESKPFWTKHSLAWGTQAIQPGTETASCPW